METEEIKFLTTYTVLMINKGSSVFMRKTNNNVLRFPGVELERYSMQQPREALKRYTENTLKVYFNDQHFNYLGIAYHNEPASTNQEKQFLVIHYWLDLDYIAKDFIVENFDYDAFLLNDPDWTLVPIGDLLDKKEKIFDGDRLAAHRLLHQKIRNH